ncbi:Pr6Pr family membrane protein ['Camptotheca acuminata' phytoplasma]|uniref:Pr6Pr family membrane protein n=1 Tax='Camptotheca acuminata' phytoplasma TaxID=3239192 RepID=UPI00351A5461
MKKNIKIFFPVISSLILFLGITKSIIMEKYLIFICLVDCFLLLFYNFIILDNSAFNNRASFDVFVANLEHIVLPLIFFIYFFLINKIQFFKKEFYIGLIHPFIYLCENLIIGNILNYYPYKFLEKDKDLFFGIMVFAFFIILSCVSFILIFLKNKILFKFKK